MPHRETDPLEVAVVGGGITGLYTAWRLATGDTGIPPTKIAVFEASDRVGGKLWSHTMCPEGTPKAELGAMFFTDSQALVHDLATGVFRLPVTEIAPKPHLAYIRSTRFKIDDLPNLPSSPYSLRDHEKGIAYHDILFNTLTNIIPDLRSFWPFNPDSTFHSTVTYLKTINVHGTPLNRWRFDELLSQAASDDAIKCLIDLVGFQSFIDESNAYDALVSLLRNLPGTWFKLTDGYQALAQALEQEIVSLGTQIFRNTELLSIDDPQDSEFLDLHLRHGTSHFRRETGRLILCTPKSSLQKIFDKASPQIADQILPHLDGIKTIPVCKMFLAFDRPWWEESKHGPDHVSFGDLSKSHTDLPIKQCYYINSARPNRHSLMMASFCDGKNAEYWLSHASEEANPTNSVINPLPASTVMEVRQQLSEMHDFPVPDPIASILVDWNAEPYSGAWFSWKATTDSATTIRLLQRPDDRAPIHICGEAANAFPGWVEGSLSSAEALLQTQFGLTNPAWLTSDESLVPYRLA